MTKTLFLAIGMALVSASCYAQESKWGLGLTGGINTNQMVLNQGYANDYQYSSRVGYNVGIVGRYQVLDWLAVRADLKLSSRNYRMDRGVKMMEEAYTNYRNTYLQLPVVADFSFGGQKLRGHFYAGGYIGGWLHAHRTGTSYGIPTEWDNGHKYYSFDEKMEFDSRRDQRFNAGATCGVGISYLIQKHWEVMLESFYQYDLTSCHKSSSWVNTPGYNNTLSCSVGILYNF